MELTSPSFAQRSVAAEAVPANGNANPATTKPAARRLKILRIFLFPSIGASPGGSIVIDPLPCRVPCLVSPGVVTLPSARLRYAAARKSNVLRGVRYDLLCRSGFNYVRADVGYHRMSNGNLTGRHGSGLMIFLPAIKKSLVKRRQAWMNSKLGLRPQDLRARPLALNLSMRASHGDRHQVRQAAPTLAFRTGA
jgi:hypothetical protein